jgi:hypothetical protein
MGKKIGEIIVSRLCMDKRRDKAPKKELIAAGKK